MYKIYTNRIWVRAYLTLQGEFTVGSMIALINLLNYIVWPFANISKAMSNVDQSIVSSQRLGEIFALPDAIPVDAFTPLYENLRSTHCKQMMFSFHTMKVNPY